MYYHVLIVDDEAHVVEALSSLLAAQVDIDCEIYTAQSAEKALEVLRDERIDLLISDVNMPGMDGLDMIDIINRNWPQCQIIILTGYSDFSNAYRAANLKVAGFLLKTENDQQILDKVHDVLDSIEKQLKQESLLSAHPLYVADDRLAKSIWADEPERSQLLTQLGMEPNRAMALCLCTVGSSDSSAVDVLLRHYLGKRISQICYCTLADDTQCLWLLQDKETDISPNMLRDLLETVQSSCHITINVEFRCVLAFADAAQLFDTFHPMQDALLTPSEDLSRVALFNAQLEQHKSVDYTIQFIMKFIREHLAESISISTLVDVTGYNADYLARLFRKHTGMTIGQYIADTRMALIMRRIRDGVTPLDDIAREAGFASRTYFNRFVKRATGMNPRNLRLTVTEEPGDEQHPI